MWLDELILGWNRVIFYVELSMFKINSGQRLLVENGKMRDKTGNRGDLKIKSEIFCETWEVSKRGKFEWENKPQHMNSFWFFISPWIEVSNGVMLF